MSRYDNYKHLLTRKYVDGKQDCYGLLVNYFKEVHKITLKNFARPNLFWHYKNYLLIEKMMGYDRWDTIGLNMRNLQIGDVLIFAIRSQTANHLGVYVGNGSFIHHLYGRLSKEDSLSSSWMSQVLMVARHKDLKLDREKVDYLNLLPNHVKRTLRIDS